MEFDDVLFPASFERRIDALFTKLNGLNDVVLKLPLHSCTIRQARVCFDSVLDVFPTVEARQNQSTRIVHSLVFESAVVTILDAREQDLTMCEKRTVRGLLLK